MTSTDAGTARVQRRVLVVLALGQVLGGTGAAIALGISSLVAARLSGSPTVGGAAVTAVVLGAAGAASVVARIAHRSGRRPALTAGYLVALVGALGAALAVTAGSAAALLGSLLLVGSGTAVGLAARFAATDLAEPTRAGRALALVVWATTVGSVAGPNLLEPLQSLAAGLGLVPATGPYLLCAAVFALAAAAGWLGLRPDPLVLARERAGAPAGGGAPIPGRVVRAAVLGSRPALVGASGVVLSHVVMVGLMSMTPVHMDGGGATLALVGVVISVHIAGMYALSPVFGWLTDRFRPGRVLALSAGMLCAAGVVCGLAAPTATGMLTVGLLLLGLGWSAGLVAGSAMFSAAVALELRARAQGTVDVAMNLGGAVGGVGAGLLVAATSYTVLGIVTAVLVLPFVLIVAAGRRDATAAA